MESLPRPRLTEKVPLYRAVAELADRLERDEYDLWADNLRACLHQGTAGEVFADLGLELYRLRQSLAARRLRLIEAVDALIATVEAAVGPPDADHLPLYCALKELVDLLRLGGALRCVRRLEAAVADEDYSDPARIARVTAALEEMAADAGGVPPGAGPCVAAVRARLARVSDTTAAIRCLTAALRPLPQP